MTSRMKLSLALALIGAGALPSAVQAAENETTFRIVAVVQPFCRITLASGDAGAATIGGRADFGAVRELCNTPGGYVVRAQFQNLDHGTLLTGDTSSPIGTDGSVEFASDMARLRVRNWSVVDLTAQSAQTLYLRVSISPL